MSAPLSDEDLAAIAAIPRSVLTDVVKAIRRLPLEYWADLVADLELAERRKVTGCIRQELHHDAGGIVGHVESNTTRTRRQGRRTA